MGMLKALVHRFGALDGAPQMLQRLLVGDAPAILTYHAVTADPLGVPDWCFLDAQRFREQLRYLKQHCNIIRLREIPAAAQAPDHRPTVALTFDDGFRNNCTVAFPIVRELELPATIFLATDFVSSEDAPWFCRIHDAVAATTLRELVWEGETYDLSSPRTRAIANARLQERVKSPQRATAEFRNQLDNPGKQLPVGREPRTGHLVDLVHIEHAVRRIRLDRSVTTVEGPNDRSVAPLELRRYGVSAYMSFAEFKLRAHHLMWKLGG
jgi:hypothetical protein